MSKLQTYYGILNGCRVKMIRLNPEYFKSQKQ